MARFELNEIFGWIYNNTVVALRVTDAGTNQQTIVDESVAGTTYVGSAPNGLAVSSSGWLLKKIVVSGTTTTITHANDSWDNRATATYT